MKTMMMMNKMADEHNHNHNQSEDAPNQPGDHVMNQLFEQYQQMHGYIEQLERAQIKLDNTIEGIQALEKLKGDEEILAPIADGMFVEAKLLTKDTVKVNIGSDTVVDKTIPQAIQMLEEQKIELQRSIKIAQSKITELEQLFQAQQ